MQIKTHNKVTGFSGNEIFCLNKLGYNAGQLCLGNNVIALGVARGLGSALSNLAGGEITEITNLVHEGRQAAYLRMMQEAKQYGGVGIAGVSFDMVTHGGNLEFIALGSTVHEQSATSNNNEKMLFSTSSSGQDLYCQLDSGFTPHNFVFSNIAYSIGVGGSIAGTFRSLKRGEVTEFTEIFNRTRHLALERIKNAAKQANANSVIGIETSIIPLLGAQEMMMTGTAASHPILEAYKNDPVTCAMTNEELWNIVNMGYMPIKLVIGVSVVSLGFVSGISAAFRSLAGGQISGLSELLYEAREKALSRIQEYAQQCNADEVLGVQTRVYDLGGGLVEFMVIGTAVKKMEGAATKNPHLLPQAIIRDRDTFIDTMTGGNVNLNSETAAAATQTQAGPFAIIGIIIFVLIMIFGRH